jgi:phosphonate transport system substrate-binding protein
MKKYPIVAALCGLALFLILVGFIGSTSAAEKNDQADTITMVFTPTGNYTQTLQAAQTLAELLETETGLTIYAYVAECDGSAIEAMAAQEADFGWFGAVPYVYANNFYDIEVKLTAVRFGASYYRGQFLVHSDSGINDLSDLAGKNFAYPNESTLSGYYYPAMLISKTLGTSDEELFDEIFFVGGHSAVVRAVYYGEYDGNPIHGGATYEDARQTVESEITDIYSKTKVITYTENIPNSTVSVRPGLDENAIQQIVDGLLDAAATQEGQEALTDLYGFEGLALADDADYDIVREFVSFAGVELESCSQSTLVDEETGGSVALTNDEGRQTTLEIPSGAVDQPTQISIAPIPLPPDLPSDFNYTGDAFELNAIISDTAQDGSHQNGVGILTTYTLTVEYDGSGLSSAQESNLALYYWQGNQWVKEASSQVDTILNTIKATPDHFSIWAVLGRDSFPVFLPLIWQTP